MSFERFEVRAQPIQKEREPKDLGREAKRIIAEPFLQELEEVPVVLCKIRRDSIEEAYHNFDRAGRQGRPVDYLCLIPGIIKRYF